MIIAKWSVAGLYHADAQTVATEIREIGESATPEQILDKARNSRTELHKCFEWNDSIAAEKYRLSTARQIVCHLVINTDESEGFEEEVRVFHKTDVAEGYKPIEYIVRNESEYEKMLTNAKRELISFKTKYQKLTELETLFEAIDELV